METDNEGPAAPTQRASTTGSVIADSAQQREGFRAALLRWFDDQQRDLPWRGVDDPYAVWVSEVMLQQTQVSTVFDYFERWMQRFPTVRKLAEAPVEEVLELWSGLGYYRRARYLHRAAGQLVEENDGELPRSVDGLRKLPGIGPYTAGAIASIAFGQSEPLVDGNVMRVISRLYTIEGKPRKSPAKQQIWDRAGELVDRQRPGDFNQALMELGSQVCTNSGPDCLLCPVRRWCQGFADGDPQRYPDTRDRPEQKPMRARSCVVWRREDDGVQFLLRRRDESGLLGGLWEFPSCECDGEKWPQRDTLYQLVAPRCGSDNLVLESSLGTVTHVFSHRKLKVKVHQVRADTGGGDAEGWRWVDDDDLAGVASSALMGKIEKLWRAHR